MSSAANLYHSVISDVISSIRDSFLDEAVDENVLVELKQLWDGDDHYPLCHKHFVHRKTKLVKFMQILRYLCSDLGN